MEKYTLTATSGTSKQFDFSQAAFCVDVAWSLPTILRVGYAESSRPFAEDEVDAIVCRGRLNLPELTEEEVLSRLGYGLADPLQGQGS